MKTLAIFGASGHGKVVADIALASGWSKVCLFDDKYPTTSNSGPCAATGNMNDLLSQLSDFDGVIVAIGNCISRWEKCKMILDAKGNLATIYHPMAYISPTAQIGKGVVIMAGTVINAGAIIGDACIINSGSIVEHDCILKHAVHIAPNATLSGNVSVDQCSWIGAGAIVKQGVHIGENVTVGAGAVVIKEVSDGLTVIGCPALPLTKKMEKSTC